MASVPPSGEISDDALLQRRKEPLTAELDGEVVMLDPDKGSYFSLNPVGSRVWELLADPRSVNEICDTLMGEFEVDEQACRQEVRALLDQLVEAELVEVRS